MSVDLAVEAGTRSGMVQSADHAQIDERVQDPIYGGARKAGNAALDTFIDLVGRRMVISPEDRPEDIPALYRQPSLAAQGLELLQPLLGIKSVHVQRMIIITIW